MGLRGPKPRPTALNNMLGNPGRRAKNPREPKPDMMTAREKPPEHLDPIAAKEWRRIVPHLVRMGLASKVDRAHLELYCAQYSTFVRCAKMNLHGLAVKTPNGMSIQSPYVGMMNRASEIIIKLGHEFGLSPSARVRLAVPGAGEDEDDPMADILKGGTGNFPYDVIDGGRA